MSNQQMNNQRTVLTALGCAGSLAAMLAVSSPASASTVTVSSEIASDDALPALVQNDSNPITDALTCSCAVCSGGIQQPVL
ncbi:MAG: hypothetical protein AAF171_13095 [Cyanobacteria bacterium P01_A01_bin.116]